MIFKINEINVPKSLYISSPIPDDEDIFLSTELNNFDREGYQLLPLEQLYYSQNSITLTNTEVANVVNKKESSWFAATQTWITLENAKEGYFLDHAFCLFRLGFEGEAKEQLMRWSEKRPELKRLFNIKPKMGIDFCLDYIDETAIELLHLEWDYNTVQDFLSDKEKLESQIVSKDWDIYTKWVKDTKEEWVNLDSDNQGNFKSKFFDFNSAMRLLKTF